MSPHHPAHPAHDGLHACVEPRRARGAQSPRPAAEGGLGREPGDYADRGVRITFRRQIAAYSGSRYTAGGYGRDEAMALSR